MLLYHSFTKQEQKIVTPFSEVVWSDGEFNFQSFQFKVFELPYVPTMSASAMDWNEPVARKNPNVQMLNVEND